jgi:hypothetical protein
LTDVSDFSTHTIHDVFDSLEDKKVIPTDSRNSFRVYFQRSMPLTGPEILRDIGIERDSILKLRRIDRGGVKEPKSRNCECLFLSFLVAG